MVMQISFLFLRWKAERVYVRTDRVHYVTRREITYPKPCVDAVLLLTMTMYRRRQK